MGSQTKDYIYDAHENKPDDDAYIEQTKNGVLYMNCIVCSQTGVFTPHPPLKRFEVLRIVVGGIP